MFAFRRVNVATTFSSPSLAATLPLFQGNLLRNQYKQQKHLYFGTKQQLKAQEMNVLLNVLELYTALQNDLLKIQLAEQRIDLLQNQIAQKKAQAESGLLRNSEVLQLEAQLATEKANLNQYSSQYQQDLLQLLFLLRLKPDRYYRIEPFPIDTFLLFKELPPIEAVLSAVLDAHPQLKGAEERLKSEEYQMKAAKSQLLPQLTLSAAIGSNYSSNGGQIELNPVTGEIIRTRTRWEEQIPDNFYQSVSVRLNVPIFDRFQARLNVSKSLLNYQKQQIQYEKAKQQVIQQVYQTYFQIQSLQSSLQARKKQMEASQLSFQEAKTQYELGKLNFLDYQNQLNQYQTAILQYQTDIQLLLLAWRKLLLLQGQDLDQ
jgi:outer membrane protein